MKFFMDTAEVGYLKAMDEAGFLDGVTTNPSLIAKSGRDFKEVVAEICELTKTPVSAEVAALETAEMIAEGERLASIADNVVVKLPLTIDGLIACQYFKRIGVKTNVTLCFTPSQALLAAKAGATYISPFIGRLDDIGLDGCQVVRDIRAIYDTYHFDTEIIAASVRTVNHVTEAAIAGSDIATMPPSLFEKLIDHPLTKVGVEKFVDDWKSTGQSIL